MRRVPIIPTIIVLAAVAVMLWLGFWQLDRKAEKEALIEQAEYALHMPQVVDYESDLMIDGPSNYRRVRLECTFAGEDRPIAGKSASGQLGWAHEFDCRFPSKMRGTSNADVVIGWNTSPALVQWSGGTVTGTKVPGRVNETPKGNIGKLRVIADPPLAGLEANATPDPRDIPNNHLSYAIQWFLFALTALVIYALALRKKWREQDKAA